VKSQYITDRLTDGYTAEQARTSFLNKRNELLGLGRTDAEINTELGVTLNPIMSYSGGYSSIVSQGDTGYSQPMEVLGDAGRFNWDKEPVMDGFTQYPKFAFETESGTKYHQIATTVQGGRWENMPNAEDKYNEYLQWNKEDVSADLFNVWGNKPELASEIAQIIDAGMSWDQAKDRLQFFDTTRQNNLDDGTKDEVFGNPEIMPEGFVRMRTDIESWDIEGDVPVYSINPEYQVVPAEFEETTLMRTREWARKNQWYWSDEDQRRKPPIDMNPDEYEWDWFDTIEHGVQQSVFAMGIKFHSIEDGETLTLKELLGESIYLEEQPMMKQLVYAAAGIVPDSPIFWAGCKGGTAVGGAVGSAVPAVGTATGATVGCFAGMFGVHGAIRSIYNDLLENAVDVENEQDFMKYLTNAIREFGAEAVIGAITGTASAAFTKLAMNSKNPFVRSIIKGTTGKNGKKYGENSARLLTEAIAMTEAAHLDPVRNTLDLTLPDGIFPTASEFAHSVAVLSILHTTNTGISKTLAPIKLRLGTTDYAVNKRLRKIFVQFGIRPETFTSYLKDNPEIAKGIIEAMRATPRIKNGKYFYDLPKEIQASLHAIIIQGQKSTAKHTTTDGIYRASQYTYQHDRASGGQKIELTTAEHATAAAKEGTPVVQNVRVTLRRARDKGINAWEIEKFDGEVSAEGLKHMIEMFAEKGNDIYIGKGVEVPTELISIIDSVITKRTEKHDSEIKDLTDLDIDLFQIDDMIRTKGLEAAELGGGKEAQKLVVDSLLTMKELVYGESIEAASIKSKELIEKRTLELLRQSSEKEYDNNGGFHLPEYLIATNQIKLKGQHEFSSIEAVKLPTVEEIRKNNDEGWAIVSHSSRRSDLTSFDARSEFLLHIGDDAQAAARLDNPFIYRVLSKISNPLVIKSEQLANGLEDWRGVVSYLQRKGVDLMTRDEAQDIARKRVGSTTYPNSNMAMRSFLMERGYDAIYYRNEVKDVKGKSEARDSAVLLDMSKVKILGVMKKEYDANGKLKLNFTKELANAEALDLASTQSFNLGLVRDAERFNRMLELPDIVELGRLMMDGKFAVVTNKLPEGVRGRAIVHEGAELKAAIKINAELGKDTAQLMATLMHEIGHVVDYISKEGDHTMARGNILGRIASLKKHFGKYYQGTPSGEKPLTKSEIKDLQKEARRLINETAKDLSNIKEVKDLGITPQQIKDIFTGVMKRAEVDPKLYLFIQKAHRKLKKEITRSAMKGQIHPEIVKILDAGAKTNATPDHLADKVKAKFKEMFEAEVTRRKLLSQDLIHQELYELSKEWRPFNEETASKDFLAYRNSSKEIFADFISALVVNPFFTKQKAPNAYDGFMSWLHEGHPKFRENWFKLQDALNTPNGSRKNLNLRILNGMRDGDLKRIEMMEQDLDPKEGSNTMKYKLYDEYFAITRDQNLFEDRTGKTWREGEDPTLSVEKMLYNKSAHEQYISDLQLMVREFAKDMEIPQSNIELYLFYRRIALGDRSELINPYGVDRKVATEEMAVLEAQHPELRDVAEQFWMVRQKNFINEVQDSNMFDPKLKQKIIENKDYVKFNIVEHMDARYGKGMGAKLIGQIGTFKGVESPLTATVFSDLSIIDAVVKNKAIDNTIKMYEEALKVAPKMFHFEKAEYETVMLNGFAVERPVEPHGEKYKGKNLELLMVMREGKLKGFYVDKWVAKAFKESAIDRYKSWSLIQHMNSYFREVYTVSNPGFMLFNAARDFQRTVKNLPSRGWYDEVPLVKWASYLPFWAKGGIDGIHRYFGIKSQVIENMRSNRSLISVAEPWGEPSDVMAMERRIAQFSQSKASWNEYIHHPFRTMIDGVRIFGQFVETQNKAGGQRYLERHFPELSAERIAHIVRVQLGSPAFLRKGEAFSVYNNLFMFSNAMKEGWRGDWESFRRDPTTGKKSSKRSAEYLNSTFQQAFATKALMFAMAQGLVGLTDEDKAKNATIMGMVSNYIKTNYIVIPLDLVEVQGPDGESWVQKGIVLTIPLDETARFISGNVWQMLTNSPLAHPATRTGEFGEGLMDYAAGQTPSFSPLFKMLQQAGDYYIGNGNPYDYFREENVISEQAQKAGGEARSTEWQDNIWSSMGGRIFYKDTPDWIRNVMGYENRIDLGDLSNLGKEDANNKLLTFIKENNDLPFMENILGRWLRVVDSGDLPHALGTVKNEAMYSQENIDINNAIAKMLTGHGDQITERESIALQSKKGKDILSRSSNMMRRYGSNAWMHEFRSANGDKRKEADILAAALKLKNATGDLNAKQFLDTYYQKGIKGMKRDMGRSGAMPNFPNIQ